MSKKIAVKLIVAAILVVFGGCIFVGVLAANGWDIGALSTFKVVTNSYKITDDFNSISIDTDTSDISILPSEGTEYRVVCNERENLVHKVFVENGTLKIELVDERKWYEYIGIDFSSTSIEIYLPKGEYESLTVKASTADVDIGAGFEFASADISVTTGDVSLAGFLCDTLKIDTNTGGVSLEYVIALNDIKIKCTTGDVELDRCDAKEIEIKATTGDVEGTLLSPKSFVVDTTTGDVSVPENGVGGVCRISTTTGDIIISVA